MYYKTFLPVRFGSQRGRHINKALRVAFCTVFEQEVNGIEAPTASQPLFTSELIELIKYKPNTFEQLPNFPDALSVISRAFYLFHLMTLSPASDVIGFLRSMLNLAVHVKGTRETKLIKRLTLSLLGHFTLIHDLR
jgi:hypothetical protein